MIDNVVEFRGRAGDLASLAGQLKLVAEGGAGTRGRAVIVTGRRRVGKSRLVQEFCDRSGVPYVVFQATRGRQPAAERAELLATVAQAPFPGSEVVAGASSTDWNHTLRSVALAVPEHTPSIVVLDEVPWLVQQDREFEGALQTEWDRYLSARPVLLILVGSDLSVMEALQQYGRPFFGRAAPMVVRPMHPADVADMTGLDAADAIDASLITGGFPELVQLWTPGMTGENYLRSALSDSLSPLLTAGRLALLGEFPEPTLARVVLEAIGAGERTFSTIASKAGAPESLPSGTLAPILANLIAKRVVTVDTPLSAKPDNKNKRYRIEDSYLRFWLAFLRRGIAEVERGRGDLVCDRIQRSWTSWRGRAVEPLVRESLLRLLPNEQWPDAEAIGGWWNRQNNPEVDLIGADREGVAGRVRFTGSIKWLERQPFGQREYEDLLAGSMSVPGRDTDTPMVVVSRAGVEPRLPLAAAWTPDDLVNAWR